MDKDACDPQPGSVSKERQPSGYVKSIGHYSCTPPVVGRSYDIMEQN